MDKRTESDVTKVDQGVPFENMNRRQKVVFILKVAVCIITFGMAFPNVMGD